LDWIRDPVKWLELNALNIVFTLLFAVTVLGIIRFISNQVESLRRRDRLDRNASFLINRVATWGGYIIIIAFILNQFGFKISTVAGLLAVASGTVIGFAAMNTLGNAIAGLIVMTSRPFRIGDRILFQGEFADILDIDLIYTSMKTTDNVNISVPNQMLIQSVITNFGRGEVTRRRCVITADFSEPPERVESALLEALEGVEGVLEEPEPYVWISEIGNFAIEYTLYYHIRELKSINRIDAMVRRAVKTTCDRLEIDLSTPNLIKAVR